MKFSSALFALAVILSPAGWSRESQNAGSTSTHASVDSYKQSPERYFRLTFRVLDLSAEEKVTNSRSYGEMIATGPKSEFIGSIRTGDRVPVATGTGSLQFQYIDIGTKIDAKRAEVIDQMLRLHVTADISSMSKTTPGTAERPVIRQTSWDSNVIVPIGKPMLIFSSDNSADRGKTELELTAVPIY
jgi:hypothetical protein